MRKKKVAEITEFYTAKRIDNSRLVRHVEPAKMKNLYKTSALGGLVAMFLMFYVYQHFQCIDLSFQLEELKGKQAQAASLNSQLKVEIAALRNPMRIDIIAKRQLGFTEPAAVQVHEYESTPGAEVAAVRLVRATRAR